jgi:hypothetical protein
MGNLECIYVLASEARLSVVDPILTREYVERPCCQSSNRQRPACKALPPAAYAMTTVMRDLGHPEAPPEESTKGDIACAKMQPLCFGSDLSWLLSPCEMITCLDALIAIWIRNLSGCPTGIRRRPAQGG